MLSVEHLKNYHFNQIKKKTIYHNRLSGHFELVTTVFEQNWSGTSKTEKQNTHEKNIVSVHTNQPATCQLIRWEYVYSNDVQPLTCVLFASVAKMVGFLVKFVAVESLYPSREKKNNKTTKQTEKPLGFATTLWIFHINENKTFISMFDSQHAIHGTRRQRTNK